jgi:hypothetical protein
MSATNGKYFHITGFFCFQNPAIFVSQKIKKLFTVKETLKFFIHIHFCFKKAFTVLHEPLAYPNGLLDLHTETFGRTPWPGDQPDARPLPTQDNTTQKHTDTHPCPKQDLNL